MSMVAKLVMLGCGGFIGSHLLDVLLPSGEYDIEGWDPCARGARRELSETRADAAGRGAGPLATGANELSSRHERPSHRGTVLSRRPVRIAVCQTQRRRDADCLVHQSSASFGASLP